jgi:hypothetical protein
MTAEDLSREILDTLESSWVQAQKNLFLHYFLWNKGGTGIIKTMKSLGYTRKHWNKTSLLSNIINNC